jgi:glutamate-1-semialdehyde 2,1-aminomutase
MLRASLEEKSDRFGQMTHISPSTIEALTRRESQAYREARPKTAVAISGGARGFLGGVPMHWMQDWPLPFPMLIEQAHGATIIDIDGNQLDDFCLGDTGSMFGHSPAPVARAIERQASRGLTYMLPNEDALAVGRLLPEKFGLPHWQIATTATDANRFALRVARAVTGRPKILVFNGCYHGSVDETMVRLRDGRPINRPASRANSAISRNQRRSSSSTISLPLMKPFATGPSPA